MCMRFSTYAESKKRKRCRVGVSSLLFLGIYVLVMGNTLKNYETLKTKLDSELKLCG